MKITKIAAQIKTQGRYSIFIDDKYAFGLSELGLINSGLKAGMELSETELNEYKGQAEIDKAYNRALGLLARRPRSCWEMEQYLKKNLRSKSSDSVDTYPETQYVAEVLAKLSDRGFINDMDFASRWVESRRLLKSTSKRKLSLELKQKRVDDAIIRRVLADDETDEQKVLKELIVRKRTQSRYRDQTKLIRYLAGQGFRYGDIKQALNDSD